MAENDDDHDGSGERRPARYRWRYGPLRLDMPWACIAVGLAFLIAHRSPVLVGGGVVLIVFGVVAFFVYRFMARRGL